MPNLANAYNTDLLSEENVKKYVLPHYGMENADISQIKFKDTDKQRAVYKVDYYENSYCLKKVYFSPNELLFVYSATEWLYRYGINVPRILPTLNNGRYVCENDMLFIMTPWIEGTKCNYDNIQYLLDSSANLAKMHLVSEKFSPIEGSAKRTGFEDNYVLFSKHLSQLLQSSNLAFKYKDPFSKLFLQSFDSNLYLAKISSFVASTIDNNALSKSLCHLDYVNKNIIFDSQNKIWVIDFDKCKVDYCAHDISYFLRRLLKRDNTKWNLELAINCLNMYETVRPLNFNEYKAIFVYLAFPQKYWKISRDYYNNINKCNKNSFVKLLKRSVEKTDNQVQFIDEFKNYIEEKFKTEIVKNTGI